MAERNNEWDLPVPCGNCPFRKEGAIKLRPGRLKGIIRDILSDRTFYCHKRLSGDRDYEVGESYRPGEADKVCAGSIIYMEKLNRPNQMMRIAERLGLYDRKPVMAHLDLVIDPK